VRSNFQLGILANLSSEGLAPELAFYILRAWECRIIDSRAPRRWRSLHYLGPSFGHLFAPVAPTDTICTKILQLVQIAFIETNATYVKPFDLIHAHITAPTLNHNLVL
jgi:hypothetical protein